MTNDFPLVAVREFRERIHTYTEPVTVVHTRGQLRILGTWYPDGVPVPVNGLMVTTETATSGPPAKVNIMMKP